MQDHEQQHDQHSEPVTTGLPETDQAQHFKTLAVRVEEELHAQLRFIAQLTGTSLSDQIRTALQARVTTAQDDPDLIARAQQARSEIEREAAARAAAIAGFIGKPAVDTVLDQPVTAPRTQRSSRTATK